MEIFVRDHRFDPLERQIGRSIGMRQYTTGVENIKALVLHGAHIEIVHRDDHEDIQVVLAAIDLFVPAHGTLEAVHRMRTLLAIFRLDIDTQVNIAAAHGGKAVLNQT